jgi:hypothetical protein
VTSKPSRSYANGTLTFAADFNSDAVLESFSGAENVRFLDRSLVPIESRKPAVVIVHLASPYLLTKARGEAVGASAVEVSTDGGKTFKAVALADFTDAVRGQVSAEVRITIKQSLRALKLEATVQNNSGALPYLSPGRNIVEVSVADPKSLGNNRLAVTYAYRLGSRRKSFAQMYGEDKELAKAHDATWDDTITCVQKMFAAGDLPAKFAIDCPTPKGRYPVYPRMLFVRREVLSPDQSPTALPAAATTPKVGANGQLATLPSPWLTGAQLPAAPARATMRTSLQVKKVPFAAKEGEFIQHPLIEVAP